MPGTPPLRIKQSYMFERHIPAACGARNRRAPERHTKGTGGERAAAGGGRQARRERRLAEADGVEVGLVGAGGRAAEVFGPRVKDIVLACTHTHTATSGKLYK